MIKQFFFLLVFLTGAGILFGQKTSDPRLAGLDTLVNRVLHDWHAAGCGIAVVEKNKVLFAGGFGFRDYEAQKPVTANTVFQIGSCTKAFTSALLGMLASEGKLDFDEPVQTYLPGLRLYNDILNTQLSVRDLSCHRSGLPRHDMAWYLNPTTRDSFVYRMRYFEPSAGLRERWQYNNYGFLLQGVIAEKLTGKSWEDNIRARIFKPLDMKTALFDPWNAPKTADVAKGYYDKDGAIRFMDYYHIEGMGPAGSITASAADMANWLLAWINGGKFNGQEVLPAAQLREAISTQMVIGSGVPNPDNPNIFFANYGMGWMLNSYYGHYRVEHGGNINGFTASTCFFPTDSIGVVVLVNQNNSQVPAILRNQILDRLLKLPYRDWNYVLKQVAAKQKAAAAGVIRSDSLSRKTGTHPSHLLAEYAGTYEHPGYGRIVLSLQHDTLMAYTPGLKFFLQHYHYDIFRPISRVEGLDIEEDSPIRLQFQTNLNGDITEMHAIGLEPTVKEIVFTKKAVAVPVSKNALDQYCGEYVLGGIVCKIYLRPDNTLMVFVPGQPDYETIPIGNHEFKLKILDGYSVRFEVDSAGKATAVNFVQPNGTFKAVRK